MSLEIVMMQTVLAHRSGGLASQSHFGAWARLTMRLPRCDSAPISAISAADSCEIEYREIFLQSPHFAGARDDDDTLLDQPAQADLRRALVVRHTDLFQHRVALGAAARDRAIGDDGDAVRLAGRDHFALVEKRMVFDLIARRSARSSPSPPRSSSATVKFETPICLT